MSLEWTETVVDYVMPATDAEEYGPKREIHVVVFVVDLTFSKHQRHLVTESIKRVRGFGTSCADVDGWMLWSRQLNRWIRMCMWAWFW